MSSKPETTFIASVHRHLTDVYHEKMHNPYRGGTPDVWYSGDRGDLWVEYKYIPTIPKRAELKPALSKLQAEWLAGRRTEGRNMAVVVGCPEGCVVYTRGNWMRPLSPDEFRASLITRKQMADWIREDTGVSSAELNKRSGSKRAGK